MENGSYWPSRQVNQTVCLCDFVRQSWTDSRHQWADRSLWDEVLEQLHVGLALEAANDTVGTVSMHMHMFMRTVLATESLPIVLPLDFNTWACRMCSILWIISWCSWVHDNPCSMTIEMYAKQQNRISVHIALTCGELGVSTAPTAEHLPTRNLQQCSCLSRPAPATSQAMNLRISVPSFTSLVSIFELCKNQLGCMYCGSCVCSVCPFCPRRAILASWASGPSYCLDFIFLFKLAIGSGL
jgi:hypothetical protein